MAEKAVLKFLEEHNRPFSVNDIHSSLKDGEFGKTAVQKALDCLVEKEKVKEKVYGKQKVYHIKQENAASSTEFKEDLLKLDRKINETSLQLKDVSDKVKENNQQVSKFKGQISFGEAVEKKMKLDEKYRDVKQKLSSFEGCEMVKPEVRKRIQEDYDKYFNAYNKRKRMCLDILGNILENYPKTKKDLYDDIGIETDEDVGFVLEQI